MTNSRALAYDAVDWRAHLVGVADLDATADVASGGIVELRRFQDAAGRQRVALAMRSDLPLDVQVQTSGATRLDRQLLGSHPAALISTGCGKEVRDGMDARIEHLIEQGFARRHGQRVVFARDLLDTLRRRELEAAAAQSSSSVGVPYHAAKEGERVAARPADEDEPQ